MPVIRCDNCNALLQAGATTCEYCGAVQRGQPAAQTQPPVTPRPTEIEPEIAALLRQKRPIEAIKRYRELHECGLKEAKNAIDKALEQMDRRR